MKIKDGFVLREIGGEYVVVAVGRQTLDFEGLITLNETGAFLWKRLQEECTQEQLCAALTAEYAVDAATAATDVAAFADRLREAELLV